MTASFLRRGFAGLALLTLLTACAPKPWDDPIQVTQLVRLEPGDFRVRTQIPAGLGETGQALFHWTIVTHDDQAESVEDLEMVRVGDPVPQGNGMTEVTYKLTPAGYKTFQTQQIRQRAQLLAGYYYLGVAVIPDLCRMAGTDARRDYVVSVLFNGRNGEKITTFRLDTPASEIQPQVGFCV
ncbi:hypothetical protein [Mangrovicoccus algicola]|uniref:Lipoprotein n=1 Tax=Mangrovicoccus algicola TaxID=2771008 RepID=A0A8J6YWR5_9RHOB|nr:hypothetical protein [Mangrovicoccus algicola]MBE3639167.1 hypothetical protein [Mangrovicoccus algicola]